MMLRLRLVLLAVLIGTLSGASPAISIPPGSILSIEFENDSFGGGTDRHFTHGTRIECLTPPVEWISQAADRFPGFTSPEAEKSPGDPVTARASFSIGQNIYTPEDKDTEELVVDDRPYAGWLYLGLGVAANQGTRRYDKIQLRAGIVGPCSQAEDVQTFWHRSFDIDVPKGWDNQLDNEPGVALIYEQARRFQKENALGLLDFDLLPHFGGSLGNVFTYGSAGFTLRCGSGLGRDFGTPCVRPSLPGGCYFRPGEGLSWYLFAGVEGRAVLWNIFLDGNTFSESHQVDRRPFVGDLQMGVSVHWRRFRFSYTQVYRTEEFVEQDNGNVFGSFSFSYHF